MSDVNAKVLLDLLRQPANSLCADCGSKNLEWASYNIGIFLCTHCACVHRGMGAHISKVKHLKLDRWEDSQVARMREIGNAGAKVKYEQHVPPCYRRPVEGDPQSLLEDWICAKYQREEFIRPERQCFMSGYLEGFLMKRGKEDPRFYPRKFVLSEIEDTLKYYVKEKKEPKAVLRVSELNVAFVPDKTDNPNCLQLSYMRSGDSVTRHIYVAHDDPQTIVNWYMAIRCAKMHRLRVAFPATEQSELLCLLTKDFAREGWLWKTGPRPTDAYKKRWFTLDQRKLMYHEEPMDAHPKGEIFIGHMLDGYSVRVGVSPGAKDQGFSFTLHTPHRWFYLAASTEPDRDLWIHTLNAVIDTPLTPQDNTLAARLIRKKWNSAMNLFSQR